MWQRQDNAISMETVMPKDQYLNWLSMCKYEGTLLQEGVSFLLAF